MFWSTTSADTVTAVGAPPLCRNDDCTALQPLLAPVPIAVLVGLVADVEGGVKMRMRWMVVSSIEALSAVSAAHRLSDEREGRGWPDHGEGVQAEMEERDTAGEEEDAGGGGGEEREGAAVHTVIAGPYLDEPCIPDPSAVLWYPLAGMAWPAEPAPV